MLKYRRAREGELDQLFEIMQHEVGNYLREAMVLMGINMEEFRNLFGTVGEVHVISLDNKVAGFYWIEKRAKVLHLHGLVVASEFQGLGIGRSVLEMLENQFKDDFEIIELGVHESNRKARDLYNKLGYIVVKSLPDLGFHIMQKRINGSMNIECQRRVDSHG
ncbi:MAG: GNAT family N-acetyltransferase [bacterium]